MIFYKEGRFHSKIVIIGKLRTDNLDHTDKNLQQITPASSKWKQS